MDHIVTVQQYINLSLIAWLCLTPEQTLCSPGLRVLVALITLRVYRPPFITSKYQLTGRFTPQHLLPYSFRGRQHVVVPIMSEEVSMFIAFDWKSKVKCLLCDVTVAFVLLCIFVRQ